MDKIRLLIKKNSTVIKYIISAGISFAIDLILFTVLNHLIFSRLGDISIIISTVIARILSSFVNYYGNKNIVFRHKEGKMIDKDSLWKYYVLVVIQMIISFTLVYYLKKITSFNPSYIKIPVDIVIFIINFLIQKILIFKDKEN